MPPKLRRGVERPHEGILSHFLGVLPIAKNPIGHRR